MHADSTVPTLPTHTLMASGGRSAETFQEQTHKFIPSTRYVKIAVTNDGKMLHFKTMQWKNQYLYNSRMGVSKMHDAFQGLR